MSPKQAEASVEMTVAPILMSMIKQCLNPGYANRNGFDQKVFIRGLPCSIPDFKRMFPHSKYYPVKQKRLQSD